MNMADFYRADSPVFAAANDLREQKVKHLHALAAELEDLTGYTVDLTVRHDSLVVVDCTAPCSTVTMATASCSLDGMVQWLDGFKTAAFVSAYAQEIDGCKLDSCGHTPAAT